jgi:hypothetical protein
MDAGKIGVFNIIHNSCLLNLYFLLIKILSCPCFFIFLWQSIVADMRKVLAKNPHIEQQKLHRRVFFEKIDPKNQALMVIPHMSNSIFWLKY